MKEAYHFLVQQGVVFEEDREHQSPRLLDLVGRVFVHYAHIGVFEGSLFLLRALIEPERLELVVLRPGPSLAPASPAEAARASAEEASENVFDVEASASHVEIESASLAVSEASSAAGVVLVLLELLDRLVAALVVDLSLLRVFERLVRFGYVCELVLRHFLVLLRHPVRVELLRQLSEGLLYLLFGGIALDSKDRVVVLPRCHHFHANHSQDDRDQQQPLVVFSLHIHSADQ